MWLNDVRFLLYVFQQSRHECKSASRITASVGLQYDWSLTGLHFVLSIVGGGPGSGWQIPDRDKAESLCSGLTDRYTSTSPKRVCIRFGLVNDVT